ncbi:MAG: relaxase/mobilization nuclease domain-containing protein [Bacteroidales bacterium]|jgi:hypothetical protein|nr:relaxase/mobilization nuclease domain-containing protein [Bacteroidales bacterium]
MIANITSGTSFSGLINYIFGKEKDAEIIDTVGVSDDTKSMASEFDLQAKMNNRVKNKVGHISLSFKPEDSDKLTNEFMTELAKEYLEEMGIVNTQYMLARHFDREHQHYHICFNRIDNDGKRISSSFDFKKNEDVCKKLKIKHGLTFSEGKVNIKPDRLKGEQKVKYEIYGAIKECLPQSKSWEDLMVNLEERNILLHFKTKGDTDIKEGVIFSKDEYSFSGSKIDRQFSYGNLNKHFTELDQTESQKSNLQENNTSTLNNVLETIADFIPDIDIGGITFSGGGYLSTRPNEPIDEEEEKRKKKKRKKGQGIKF